ncbi:MAG: S41 family peptidase, partial [Paludibacter sp.]|nr:S41 family peptidase [Paludibacter sp.]
IKLPECDENFDKFFIEKYDSIRTFGNLIVDLSYNRGGLGEMTTALIFSLTNLDTLRWLDLKTRINNAHYKANATSRFYYVPPEDVTEKEKALYYPFFYDNAFETVKNENFSNPVALEERYKGNIYIIINEFTASAAEQVILTMQRSKKVKIIGKKTSGALGLSLTVKLLSGITVIINTGKTYNSSGYDVSSGIPPDYEYDFSEFYKTGNKQEMLSKFIKVIKEFENKK